MMTRIYEALQQQIYDQTGEIISLDKIKEDFGNMTTEEQDGDIQLAKDNGHLGMFF